MLLLLIFLDVLKKTPHMKAVFAVSCFYTAFTLFVPDSIYIPYVLSVAAGMWAQLF